MSGAAESSRDSAAPSPADSPGGGLVARLRDAHLEMVDAVLGGGGLERVAQLAARAASAQVVLVVPELAAYASSEPPPAQDPALLGELRAYVADRCRDRPVKVPASVQLEVPVTSGGDLLGCVLLLGGGEEPAADAAEFLHLAAVACLTEIAVAQAREQVEENLRGSFLEELRSGASMPAGEAVRRGGRLGCDLSRGAVALCAELRTERPRHVAATIAGDHPGALVQHAENGTPRLYALLPALEGDDGRARTLARARELADRLGRHGVVGLSSLVADPADLGRALEEAELVLEVLLRGPEHSEGSLREIGTGTYRLLLRVLASHPEEVRSFYEDTVAPLVHHDEQYRTDLVGTLESYLEHNCNMNATAGAIYAHRHTVAYRLDRVRELTGLDPTLSEHRERLGLGLKALRIIAPQLPR